jgi:hypothetical protein
MTGSRRVAISTHDAGVAATFVMDEAGHLGRCLGCLIRDLGTVDTLGIRIYSEAVERHASAWLLAARIYGHRDSLAFLSGACGRRASVARCSP